MNSKQTESLDSLLSSIVESVDSTFSAVAKIEDDFLSDNKDLQPTLIKSLIKTLADDETNALDSISLLSLKNSALLGYVTDLALLLAIRLKSLKENINNDKKGEVLNSIVTNRVILERGIKALEKKISYQLEKMVNAYHRRKKEQEDLEQKIKDNSDNEEASEENDDDDNDEEGEGEEGLNFKPNPSALLKKSGRNVKTGEMKESIQEDGETEITDHKSSKSNEKYKPPKISATAINDPDKQVKHRKQRNLQSMDEYLQDISEAPSIEKSIGSTIINKGRDVKSKRQLEKEAELQRYEEENFTRLPTTKTKEDKKERAKRMRNEFFGEDWSMFENNMSVNGGDNNNKKRKRLSAWERAKRKINE
jgi:U3 small nucleolar ribonucleoprotein protein LCP5